MISSSSGGGPPLSYDSVAASESESGDMSVPQTPQLSHATIAAPNASASGRLPSPAMPRSNVLGITHAAGSSWSRV